jgi:hypothetical protein
MPEQWGCMCRTFKVEHLQRMPWAEICWYFTETQEQYRIGGNLTLVWEDDPDAQLRQVAQDSHALLFLLPRSTCNS